MNEKLTTGQMIDRLKIGEKADGVYGVYNYVVTKLKSGKIVFLDEDEATIIDTHLDDKVLSATWTIRHRFVTFEEAIKALREGKTVSLYMKDKKQTFSLVECIAESLELDENYLITWEDLFEGDWIIEN